MTTINATKARAELYRLLEQVAESHEPIQIKGKKASAVLLSEDDWRAVQETLHLLSVPGMRESVVEGLQTPVEDCAAELEW